MSAEVERTHFSRSPTVLGAQRWTATLAALSAFVAAAISGELPVPLLGAFLISVAGATVWGHKTAHRFVWAWTTALAGSLLVLASQVLAGGTDLVLSAAWFVVLLLVHRLWNRATARDEIVLLLLSLLLLCGGAALTAELIFGLSFAAYAVAATWALALLHLRGEIEAGRSSDGSQAMLSSRRLATPRLFGALAALAIAGLAGSALVFFAFPRVTIGGFHRVAKGRSVAGLSNRIDLGGAGQINDDPRVVLRVRFEPPVVHGDLGNHWRAYALDVWTGQGWQQRPSVAVPLPTPRLPQGPFPPRPADLRRVEIEAVAGFSDGVIFTPPGWPVSVGFQRPPLAREGSGPRLLRNQSGDLSYAPVEVGDLTYNVLSNVRLPSPSELRGRGQKYPEGVASSLEVPARLDLRVRQLAAQLSAGLDPADAADRVEGWLRSNLKYTRELTSGGADPIADFLFARREGHCELFASAMVLLLRSAGIPARAVSGYYGGTWSRAGYHVVRAGDAHSWVEVYFPGYGFLPFDPTPASERGGREGGLLAKVVLVWDAIASRWRANVVDYDLLKQGRLLKSVLASFQDATRRLSSRSGSPGALNVPWVRVAGVLLIVLAPVGAVIAWRRRRADLRHPLRADERRAIELWRRARQRLASAGIAVPKGTTPREALRRSAALEPAAREAARKLVDRYLEARWGGGTMAAAEARALLQTLDREL